MEDKINTRFLGMLGFAMRAGRVLLGTDIVISAMQKGRARLIIVSEGASEGTKSKIKFKSEFYSVPVIYTTLTGDELGDRLGKSYSPVVLCVTDDGFASEILKAKEKDSNTDSSIG